MKVTGVLILVLLQAYSAIAQKGKKEIHKGNQLYQQKKYADAEESYRKSLTKGGQTLPANFNLADALYKQKKFDNAAQKFTEIAGSARDKSVKAKAYHNLGNSLLESNKLKESVEAYKKSLINNPKDDETRYNLAYAMEKLKDQENKDKKENKDQNKKDQDKDKNKDKDKQDQKDKDKDKNKQDPGQDKQDKDQQGNQPKPDQLSKEDAERMLDAMNQEEKNTQDKLKNKKSKGVKGKIVKDW